MKKRFLFPIQDELLGTKFSPFLIGKRQAPSVRPKQGLIKPEACQVGYRVGVGQILADLVPGMVALIEDYGLSYSQGDQPWLLTYWAWVAR